MSHTPVMPEEVLEALAVKPDGMYVDCTAGAAGHSALIAERLDGGRLIALDRDPMAVGMARERLKVYAGVEVVQANYSALKKVLEELGIVVVEETRQSGDWRSRDGSLPPSGVDGVLLDAGCSSMQLDQRERGFSFEGSGPLDMRMDPTSGVSAAAMLRGMEEAELAELLKDYGDVPQARRIARAIVERAKRGELETTADLVAAVKEALPFVGGVPEEVRTVFQAVRIAVNEELTHLAQGVRAALEVLKPGGRLAVLTFHSGEDRVVKTVLQEASREQRTYRPDGRVAGKVAPVAKLVTKKPVLPGEAEMKRNPRSKSAKLRVAERL